MITECIQALEKFSAEKESEAKAIAVDKGKKRQRAKDILVWDESRKEKVLIS